MDFIKEKMPGLIQKYKYAALVLLIGVILMTFPGSPNSNSEIKKVNTIESETKSVESKLQDILSQVKGAGKVKVMLTVEEGSQTLYQQDTDFGSEGIKQRSTTITVTDASRNQQGLIRQTIPEGYRGAIIVCQGADSPTVRYSIIEAVSNITSLGADRICVLKMK